MPIKNIIPVADGEGSLGLPGNNWGSGFFKDAVFNNKITVSNQDITVGGNSNPQFGGQELAFTSQVPTSNDQLLNSSNYVASVGGQVTGIYRISQIDYDNLANKDPLTLYIII